MKNSASILIQYSHRFKGITVSVSYFLDLIPVKFFDIFLNILVNSSRAKNSLYKSI